MPSPVCPCPYTLDPMSLPLCPDPYALIPISLPPCPHPCALSCISLPPCPLPCALALMPRPPCALPLIPLPPYPHPHALNLMPLPPCPCSDALMTEQCLSLSLSYRAFIPTYLSHCPVHVCLSLSLFSHSSLIFFFLITHASLTQCLFIISLTQHLSHSVCVFACVMMCV